MEAPVMRKPGGFTLIEVVVAVTVLSIGSAILWYSLRSSARLEKQNRLHHAANLLARSDLESLRGLPVSGIRDSAYRLEGPGGEPLLVVREVFDSADIAAQPELTLDESLSPRQLREPREVRVRVLMAGEGDGTGFGLDPFSAWPGGNWPAGEEGRRVLVSLAIKIPEYRWR
jgi:prepilin-type N-terminal cleavage/methylation domain-containing protein